MTDNRETNDQSAASSDPAAARHRQYYEVMQDYWVLGRTPKYDWVNEKELEISGYVGLGPGPHELGTGLPPFVAPPRIVFKKRGTLQPHDFFKFDRIWVISDRFKAILANFDPKGFEFVRAETLYGGGACEGPPYWFCDVIRVLDCLDEAASTLNYYPNTTRYSVIMKAVMRPEAVGSAHVLRLRRFIRHELVDDVFWNMVHAHKVTGIAFKRLNGSLDVARTEFSPSEEECEEDDEID